MLSEIKMIAIGGAVVGLGLLAWSWHARGQEIAGLNRDLGTERANVSLLKDKVAEERAATMRLVEQRKFDQLENDRLAAEKTAAEEKAAQAVADLNQWRVRLYGEILKRPEVFERASSLATRRILRDIEAVSTGRSVGQADADTDLPPGGPGEDHGP